MDDISIRLPDSVIFGGMLRDLALVGSAGFSSDIDIVTTAPASDLKNAISSFFPVQNRFGGYRFTKQGCSFDIWRLEDTWAFKQGFVAISGFDDLLNTTFFNLDAIAYHLTRRSILTQPNYFSALQTGILDINLEANPNPERMAARALRLVQFKDVFLSPRLSEYVIRHADSSHLGHSSTSALFILKEFHTQNPEKVFNLSSVAQMDFASQAK